MQTSKTLSPKEAHHRALVSLIITSIFAFIVGLTLWYVTSNKPTSTPSIVNNQDNIRAQVAEMLRDARTQATQAEINRVAEKLSSSPVSASQEERAKVAASLSNI